MREWTGGALRSIGVGALLLVLLAAGWPEAAQGQGPDEEVARFREQRWREPESVPLAPEAQVLGISPEGLHRWQIEVVDSSWRWGGEYTSLALDSLDRPHISYYGEYDSDLKYARFDGGAWQLSTVDSAGSVGQDTSLALDAAGRPHISYFGDSGLKYAHFDGTAWYSETVDGGGSIGFGTSLALDSLGRPHISYPDGGNGDVKYAHFDGGAWKLSTVDSAGYVGRHTSLALDASDRPHIGYYDANNGDVKYAHFDGMTWHTATVDGAGSASCCTSLALDASGLPRVSYLSNDALKYARFDGNAWHIETVESIGFLEDISLALDSSGRPHIGYYGGFNLKYAYFDGTTWHTQMVENTGIVGNYTSLALDSSSRPHISYYDQNNRALKYAASLGSLADWSRLAFASYRDMNWEVYAATGDGASPVRLTNHNAVDSRPEFNRGVSQIVFDSRRSGGSYDIHKMNADGSGVVRLTSASNNEYIPTWSPDGSKIAYFGYPADPYNGEVYVMNADGSGQTRLTWDTAWDGHPTWSPDGSKIAFVSGRSGAYELWTMNADGSNQQQISYGLQYPAYPDWSPDGGRIALNDDYNLDGWFDLAVINADGTGLTHPLGASSYLYDRLAPAWAPTGQDLAFALIQYIFYQGEWYWVDAYIYGLDLSNNTTYLLESSGFDWWPDWQPSDVTPPQTQVWGLPPWSGTSFVVAWGGWDPGGAGLRSYDVQYRDGSGGIWTDWLLDTEQTSGTFTGTDGHSYYFRCRARDLAYNLEPYPDEADAWTTVDMSPPASAASSPPYAAGPGFVVTWSGTDGGSGIASYDVQYRDGAGLWTDWLAEAAYSGAYFAGEPGHTYYFQSRARDNAGNLEPYPGGDGDTHTHTPQYALEGHVLGNREQPVALATVTATPAMSNTALSGVDGAFTLYGSVAGTFTLSVMRDGFGTLPAMAGVSVPAVAEPLFYLPPLDDRIADGGFEAGDLLAWNPAGEVAPTATSTAHTGDHAAAFGGVMPPPLVTPTVAFNASAVLTAAGGLLTSSLATLRVPAGAVSGTVLFTLTGVPTVTALPTGTQDVGLHVAWAAALTDGTPLTKTLRPLTLTVVYSDAAWQAAQVAGEETLALWRYDPVSATWVPLSGTLDVLSNTVAVTQAGPGLVVLLGEPFSGPWRGTLSQEVTLAQGLLSGTLSLLYQVTAAEPASDSLRLFLAGPTQTVTYTLPLTPSGWVHRWWEVPQWAGPTLTVRLEWAQGERKRPAAVALDEVSLGPAEVGRYAVYLPLVLRHR